LQLIQITQLNNFKTEIEMDEKFNDATKQRPQGERIMDASLVTIDLHNFIKQIREEKAWKDSDRNAITVLKLMVCVLY